MQIPCSFALCLLPGSLTPTSFNPWLETTIAFDILLKRVSVNLQGEQNRKFAFFPPALISAALFQTDVHSQLELRVAKAHGHSMHFGGGIGQNDPKIPGPQQTLKNIFRAAMTERHKAF